MNKFREWMVEKGYGVIDDNGVTYYLTGSTTADVVFIYPKTQMLIGCKMEYLIEKKGSPIEFVFGNITDIKQIDEILNHKIETG